MSVTERTVIVLGRAGMLGQMVESYFDCSTYRLKFIDERYSFFERKKFIDAVAGAGPGFVINCIGAVPQQTSVEDEFYELNTQLPQDLVNGLRDDQYLIHPSTDCVFDGQYFGKYPVDYPTNARDLYGLSKKLGERALIGRERVVVVRGSILGPDRRAEGGGLLNWFLRHQAGSSINGFTNHHWNGVTSYQWCEIVETVIRDCLSENNVHGVSRLQQSLLLQAGTDRIFSKYQLLCAVQEAFGTEFNITPTEHAVPIDRTLLPTVVSPSFESQLDSLRDFSLTLQAYAGTCWRSSVNVV